MPLFRSLLVWGVVGAIVWLSVWLGREVNVSPVVVFLLLAGLAFLGGRTKT